MCECVCACVCVCVQYYESMIPSDYSSVTEHATIDCFGQNELDILPIPISVVAQNSLFSAKTASL